jgi:hypothetical protein
MERRTAVGDGSNLKSKFYAAALPLLRFFNSIAALRTASGLLPLTILLLL